MLSVAQHQLSPNMDLVVIQFMLRWTWCPCFSTYTCPFFFTVTNMFSWNHSTKHPNISCHRVSKMINFSYKLSEKANWRYDKLSEISQLPGKDDLHSITHCHTYLKTTHDLLSETEFRTVSDLKHRVILVTDSLTRRRFQDSVGFEAPCCDDSIARDHLQPG